MADKKLGVIEEAIIKGQMARAEAKKNLSPEALEGWTNGQSIDAQRALDSTTLQDATDDSLTEQRKKLAALGASEVAATGGRLASDNVTFKKKRTWKEMFFGE